MKTARCSMLAGRLSNVFDVVVDDQRACGTCRRSDRRAERRFITF